MTPATSNGVFGDIQSVFVPAIHQDVCELQLKVKEHRAIWRTIIKNRGKPISLLVWDYFSRSIWVIHRLSWFSVLFCLVFWFPGPLVSFQCLLCPSLCSPLPPGCLSPPSVCVLLTSHILLTCCSTSAVPLIVSVYSLCLPSGVCQFVFVLCPLWRFLPVGMFWIFWTLLFVVPCFLLSCYFV